MTPLADAKKKLDRVIGISRVHFYKPIQVAEILHRHRRDPAAFDLGDSLFYRTHSKAWRDEVSQMLVGRSSTSSAKYQDNVFDENACPPWALKELGVFNERKESEGVVEAYVYRRMLDKLEDISAARIYLEERGAALDIGDFVALFEARPGLKRSVDKVYEITVHALFSAIVGLLKVEVTIHFDAKNRRAVNDFKKFIEVVMGIDPSKAEVTLPAKLFRVGVTNAADRGLDMFANFGPAVQIKHLTLSSELAEDIADNIAADRIVIVCKDAEEKVIATVLSQIGMGERIKGIITFTDLKRWYAILLNEQKYGKDIATKLIASLLRDFKEEFPSVDQIKPFIASRGYDRIKMPKDWDV